MTSNQAWNRLKDVLSAALLACTLAACGGGAGGPDGSCINIDPTRTNALPGCGASTSPGGATSAPTLALTMNDASGAATMNVMPNSPATLQVSLKDAAGKAVPNIVVTFVSTDTAAVFSPSSRSALSDGNGNAAVQLAAGNQAGAFTVTASATVGASNLSAAKNYTVSFPALTMTDLTLTPSTLASGGNASISLSVMNGSVPYSTPVAVSFSSACVTAGKAIIGTPVITQSGRAVASYTDKGCSSTDTITATVTLPNATLSKSANLTVLPNSAGSIKFVGAEGANIALKGTGGPGRSESSTVKFQLFDRNGVPVIGQQVNFLFADSNTTSTTGGLQLNPVNATSAADGTVTTSVSNGTIPTSVRVVATVAGTSPPLTSVSSQLVVSSGVPDQAHFSLSTSIGNCEGWNIDHLCSTVQAILGDHFGNPVPDGTAVNFSAEGGTIGASCQTVGGVCTVPLYSAQPRPESRITVLAYALGEETFTDANGNNVFDTGDTFTDLKPNLHRDDNEGGSWNTGEPCVGINPPPACNANGDGIYNGVLRMPQVPSAQTLYVSSQLVQQFSTSAADISIAPATLSCPTGGTITALVTVKDKNGVWMPANTSLTFGAMFGFLAAPTTPSALNVPNVVLGIGQPLNIPAYPITIACPSGGASGEFTVTVRSPSGFTTIAKRAIN